MDGTTGQLVAGIRRILSAKRAFQRRLSCAGLTLPTGGAVVLDRLATAGPTRIGDLAEVGRCHLSVTSRLVTDLQAAGLVARDVDPLDGRSHLIVITDRGRDYLAHYLGEIAAVVDTALAGWPDSERVLLAEQLSRLGDGLDQSLAESGRPLPAARTTAARKTAAATTASPSRA